jgi:diacylglycerol kinase (ATP)
LPGLAGTLRTVRWTALVNPTAGRGRSSRLRTQLESQLAERGIRCTVPADSAATRRVAAAAFERGDGVVVCGGDGTVAAVAGEAATRHGAVAVVPTGTGNDFARHVGLDPRRPLAAVAVLDTGRLAACDLGRATTADGTRAWFTTVANTGFDAEANRWANQVRWTSGTAVYVLATLRTLATYQPQGLRVLVDGDELVGSTWLAAVGNTRYYAGGMMITPGAELDDGRLDVCVIGRVSRGRFLAGFPRVFRGTHPAIDGVETRRGQVVELSPVEPSGGGPGLQLWACGEPVGPLPARLEVAPGVVRVLVPEGAPLSGR